MRRGLSLLLILGLLAGGGPAWAGGSCAIYKTFVSGGQVTHTDMNSLQTTLGVTNMTPQCLDDYSTTATQMQTNTDPYPSSAASLATSLAGELERIRYVLKNVFGFTQWYTHTENITFGTRTITGGTWQGSVIGVVYGGTGLSTIAINRLLYASAADTIAGLATGNNGVLVTSAGGVPSIATDIPTAITIGAKAVQRAGDTQRLYIYAARNDGTNPPADGTVGDFPTLDFDGAGTTAEVIRFLFEVPPDMDVTASSTFNIGVTMSTSSATNARVSIDYAPIASGEALTTAPTTVATTITPNATLALYTRHAVGTVSANTFANNDIVSIEFSRVPSHADDTHAGDLRLLLFWLEYTTRRGAS